jgi:hypothetical protein
VNATRNYLTSLKKYYENVKQNFADVSRNGLLSQPLYEDLETSLWSSKTIPGSGLQFDNLIENINKKLGELNYDKVYIETAVADLNLKFKAELDSLIPYISKMGLFKACVAITNPENLNQNPISINEQNRINFFKSFIKDEDLSEISSEQLTWTFLEYYVYIRDKEVNPSVYANVSEKINQWGVYSYIYSESDEKPGSILEAFVTALNGQLVVSGKTTTNRYNDKTTGKFTIKGIRQAIADHINLPVNENYINYYIQEAASFLDYFIVPFIGLEDTTKQQQRLKAVIYDYMKQEWDKIKFMFRDMNLDNVIQTIIDNLRVRRVRRDELYYTTINTIIISRITSAQGYFGDRVILTLLENIFKIKTVVIDSSEQQIHNGSFFAFYDNKGKDGESKVLKGFVKELKFLPSSSSGVKITKDELDAPPFQKNFELMYQKIELEMLKELLVSRSQEIQNGKGRRPSGYQALIDQYNKVAKSMDVLVNILETMNCPFFFSASGGNPATLTKLTEFNDKMSEIFKQVNIIQYLESSARGGVTPLTELTQFFNGNASKKGFLADVIDYYPKFVIQTQDFSEFELSCQRLIPSYVSKEVNFFIAPPIIIQPLGAATGTPVIDDFIFLLCDDISDTYSNIFSFTENRFVYDYREIPAFYNMLIFNSLVKFSKVKRIPFFRYINPDYLQTMFDYKTKLEQNYPEPATSKPIVIENEDIASGVKRSTRTNIGKKPDRLKYGGAPPLGAGYVSTNRGNSVFASNRDSRLSYYVIIDLELYPGKDGIPLAQKAVLACQSRYEKIRQAWAKLFGLVYRPNELYVTGFTAPSTIKNRDSRDNYRSTRTRRNREDERRPRNKTERGRERGRDRRREREG